MAQIGETELDLRALALALRRQAWLLVLLAAAAAIGTYVSLGFVDPLYTADTSLLIEERESPLTRPRDESTPPPSDFDESAIQSQVEVLRSREIADAVIDALDLTHRPDFDPAQRPSVLRSLLVMIGLGTAPTDSTIRQRVMDSYFERLSVYPLQKSRVIAVEFSAPNRELAAEVANAVADAFVALQQDAKRQSAIAATDWLQQEIERLRERVEEAEHAVADYRANHGLFELDTSATSQGGNLSTQQLGDINSELARARAARAEAEAKADLIQTLLDEGGAIEASEDVLNSQLIQRLRERQGALSAQIAELSTTLLPTHPRIRALEGQVANLEAQIRGEAAKVLTSLQTAARVAAAREESLLRSLNDAKADVSRSNDQDIELRALEREAAAQRDLLESFLGRYREAAARTDANYLPADARVISRAVAPEQPSFPKKTMMSIAVAIALLLIGSALVLLKEFSSGRAFRIIGSGTEEGTAEPLKPQAAVQREVPEPKPRLLAAPSQDIEAIFSERSVLPTAPEERFDVESVMHESTEEKAPEAEEPAEEPMAADAPDEPVAESDAEPVAGENAGVAALGDIILNPSVRLALFAGAEGGEGAGGIAFTAARQGAKEKLRCLVIDMGRTPSEVLGNQRPGLCDLLGGEASFGEVIQRDETTGVHVIPYGSTGKLPPLPRMRLVLGALAHTYDKVIVVSDKLGDWPDEHVRPDVAAIVCGPDTTESSRTALYDSALTRGALSAIIVRYTSDLDLGNREESAAA